MFSSEIAMLCCRVVLIHVDDFRDLIHPKPLNNFHDGEAGNIKNNDMQVLVYISQTYCTRTPTVSSGAVHITVSDVIGLLNPA